MLVQATVWTHRFIVTLTGRIRDTNQNTMSKHNTKKRGLPCIDGTRREKKTVFDGLQMTKADTSLRISVV